VLESERASFHDLKRGSSRQETRLQNGSKESSKTRVYEILRESCLVTREKFRIKITRGQIVRKHNKTKDSHQWKPYCLWKTNGNVLGLAYVMGDEERGGG